MLRVEVRKRLPDFSLEVGFEVGREIVALVGPSGAGKTTTLRLIAGLERPDAGTIELHGRTLVSVADHRWLPPRERRCGYVFQEGALFPHLRVRENILYGTGGAPGRPLRELLETFGIGHLSERYPRALSGGERQRVAIARALMASPEVLLLDEPFSALDAETRTAVHGELQAVHSAWGIPFVLVTHDRLEAERLASRTLQLREGRVEG